MLDKLNTFKGQCVDLWNWWAYSGLNNKQIYYNRTKYKIRFSKYKSTLLLGHQKEEDRKKTIGLTLNLPESSLMVGISIYPTSVKERSEQRSNIWSIIKLGWGLGQIYRLYYIFSTRYGEEIFSSSIFLKLYFSKLS